ncbi:uncharacterized protein [Macrobrachium rosenbergii]|uniref:uncharacterized protein n=1 Tax=Macrobrachium rosenbergii TaxID=79674 RepID=UPI0034D4871B
MQLPRGKNFAIVLLFLTVFHTTTKSGTDAEELSVDVGTEEEVIAEDDEISTGKASLVLDDNEDIDSAFNNEDDVPEENDECSRISPKEIFHNEIHLRLLHALDEMSHFVEAVLIRIESALNTLLPHVQESPIGNLRVEDLFPEVRRFLHGTMRDVYDVVRASWRDLIRTHVAEASDASQQLNALRIVRDAQIQGEEKIKASLMELSVTLRAIILNSIYVLQESLKLPEHTEPKEAAAQINQKLPKVAPNFLGTLMMKIIEKGENRDAYKKLLTNTLRYITGPVNKMYEQLEDLNKAGPSTENLQIYWKSMIEESHLRLIEDPIEPPKYEIVYQNEEYLAGLVLGLMATF